MQEENQPENAEDFLKDLPLRAEEIGYKSDEMIACGNCSRTNPPNRLKCMYCGAELELSKEQAAKIAPVLRKLEGWENGFNVVYLPNDENISDDSLTQTAGSTGLDKEFLQKVLDTRKPLPLVRCETPSEAEILRDRLRENGLQTVTIDDRKLAADILPTRLRGIEFRDHYILMTNFNTDEVEVVDVEDLKLIISGALFEKSIESVEARKKGVSKILDASETASDEILVDLYTNKNSNGYRILTKGFDFSCLGEEKGILARENIKKLIAKMQTIAPTAKFVDDYLSVRNLLGDVWEVEQRKDSQGLKRQRFGKFDLSNVSTSNNLQQFTKYSRLQWHIL